MAIAVVACLVILKGAPHDLRRQMQPVQSVRNEVALGRGDGAARANGGVQRGVQQGTIRHLVLFSPADGREDGDVDDGHIEDVLVLSRDVLQTEPVSLAEVQQHEQAAVLPRQRGLPTAEGDLDGDALFSRGFIDGGGDPGLLRHLLEDLLPCEGGSSWDHEDAYHVSRAQFAHGTWNAAARATGRWDFRDPYDVGFNVAWLLDYLQRAGVSPGSTGGWPTCYWVGNVP